MKLVRENKTNYFILFVAFILLVGIAGAAELKHNSDLAQERVLELQKQGVVHKEDIAKKSAMEKESFRHKIVDLNEELDVSANLDASTIICGKTPTGEIRLKDLGKDHKLRDLKIRYSDLRGLDGVDKGFVKVTHFNDAGLPDAVWIQQIRNDGGYAYFEDVPFSEIVIGGFIGTYTISGSVNYQNSQTFGLGTAFDADSVNYLGAYVYPDFDDRYEWSFNQSGLVAWWKFDEGTGTLVSDSAGNNDGTASGMTWTDGRFGKAGHFNGVGNTVTIPDSESLRCESGDCTWVFFAKIDDTGTTEIMLQYGSTSTSSIQLYSMSDYRVKCDYRVNVSGTNTLYTDFTIFSNSYRNQYHMYVIEYNDTAKTLTGYDNGVKGNTRNLEWDLVPHIGDIRIVSSTYSGDIDNVMIFNRVLSTQEIAEIYREMCPYNVPTDGLVGYWAFDEGTGTAVNDISGNGNTGTATGMNWTDGKYNGAGSFDGVDDVVTVPSAGVNIVTPMTISFTLCNASVIGSGYEYILSKTASADWKNTDYSVFYDPSGRIYLVEGDGTNYKYTRSTNSVLGNYPKTITLCDGFVYVNGQSIPVTCSGSVNNSYTNSADLKFAYATSYGFSDIDLDNVMIYNRALSEDEIKAIYYDSIEDLQLKTNSNAEYTSEIDGYTEYLDIPYDDTDADITSITATVQESVVIGGVTVRDYRNTVTPFSLTAEVGYTENTTLIEETLTDDIYEIYIRYTPNNNYDAGSVSYVADANPILNSEYLEYTLTTNQAGSTLTYNSNTRKFTVNGVNFVEGQTYNYKITCALNPLIIPYLPPVDGFGDSRIEVDEATANETCMIGAVYDSESRNGMSIFGNWSTTLSLAILAPFIAAAVLIVLLLRKVI